MWKFAFRAGTGEETAPPPGRGNFDVDTAAVCLYLDPVASLLNCVHDLCRQTEFMVYYRKVYNRPWLKTK